jgi:hypothetical protein
VSRIAISASPVIDKSQFLAQLARENNAEVISDQLPGICKAYGYQTLYEIPSTLQIEVRANVIADHLRDLRKSENRIYAFSVFEFLADWMRWSWSCTTTELWEQIERQARQCAELYDQVYHLSDGPLKEYDGYVWFDRRNARQQNELIELLYNAFDMAGKVLRPEIVGVGA